MVVPDIIRHTLMKSRDRSSNRGSLVYSTEGGAICPRCGEPRARCVCVVERPVAAKPGQVRVGKQTQGRRGKAVTVIEGLSLAPDELARLAKELKKRCGSGGTVKSGTIEIQGDHRDLLVRELETRGFKVKRLGG